MAKENKLLKTTMLLTFIIILSKIAGFAREMILAGYFGLSVESDAYGVSYSILSIFTILFGAAIGSTFIPIYTKARVERGEAYANDYASNVLNLYIIVSILTSIAAYYFAPGLCSVMWRNEEGGELVVRLTRLMLPSLVCWCVSGVLVNLLDARKHFVPEQLIGFALSFCVILGCVVFGTIEAVAVATAVTALMQVLILAPFLRGQFRWKAVLNLKSKRLRTTFILALPALISVAFDEINHAADKIFGSEIGIGVVTSLTKSYTLVQTAISVLVIPITTVMFTQLSQYAAKKQMEELRDTVRTSIEIVAFITLPIIVICILLATDIIGVFYQRGSFTYEMTLFTAPVFAFYIAGIFGFGLRNFLTRVFYSIQKTRIPMFLGVISVSLNIVLDMAFKDTLGARGLTFATSIASLAGAVLMLIVLTRETGGLGLGKSAAQFGKMVVSAAAAGAVIWAVMRFLPVTGTTFGPQLIRLLVGVIVGFAVYMACAFGLRIHQAKRVMDILVGKLLRRGRGRTPAVQPAPADSPAAAAQEEDSFADLLEEHGTQPEQLSPIAALEAADFNYPGPELVPQPPPYRLTRVLAAEPDESAAYDPAYISARPYAPRRQRRGHEMLSVPPDRSSVRTPGTAAERSRRIIEADRSERRSAKPAPASSGRQREPVRRRDSRTPGGTLPGRERPSRRGPRQ